MRLKDFYREQDYTAKIHYPYLFPEEKASEPIAMLSAFPCLAKIYDEHVPKSQKKSRANVKQIPFAEMLFALKHFMYDDMQPKPSQENVHAALLEFCNIHQVPPSYIARVFHANAAKDNISTITFILNSVKNLRAARVESITSMHCYEYYGETRKMCAICPKNHKLYKNTESVHELSAVYHYAENLTFRKFADNRLRKSKDPSALISRIFKSVFMFMSNYSDSSGEDKVCLVPLHEYLIRFITDNCADRVLSSMSEEEFKDSFAKYAFHQSKSYVGPSSDYYQRLFESGMPTLRIADSLWHSAEIAYTEDDTRRWFSNRVSKNIKYVDDAKPDITLPVVTLSEKVPEAEESKSLEAEFGISLEEILNHAEETTHDNDIDFTKDSEYTGTDNTLYFGEEGHQILYGDDKTQTEKETSERSADRSGIGEDPAETRSVNEDLSDEINSEDYEYEADAFYPYEGEEDITWSADDKSVNENSDRSQDDDMEIGNSDISSSDEVTEHGEGDNKTNPQPSQKVSPVTESIPSVDWIDNVIGCYQCDNPEKDSFIESCRKRYSDSAAFLESMYKNTLIPFEFVKRLNGEWFIILYSKVDDILFAFGGDDYQDNAEMKSAVSQILNTGRRKKISFFALRTYGLAPCFGFEPVRDVESLSTLASLAADVPYIESSKAFMVENSSDNLFLPYHMKHYLKMYNKYIDRISRIGKTERMAGAAVMDELVGRSYVLDYWFDKGGFSVKPSPSGGYRFLYNGNSPAISVGYLVRYKLNYTESDLEEQDIVDLLTRILEGFYRHLCTHGILRTNPVCILRYYDDGFSCFIPAVLYDNLADTFYTILGDRIKRCRKNGKRVPVTIRQTFCKLDSGSVYKGERANFF